MAIRSTKFDFSLPRPGPRLSLRLLCLAMLNSDIGHCMSASSCIAQTWSLVSGKFAVEMLKMRETIIPIAFRQINLITGAVCKLL